MQGPSRFWGVDNHKSAPPNINGLGLMRAYIGIMDKKMEATMMGYIVSSNLQVIIAAA